MAFASGSYGVSGVPSNVSHASSRAACGRQMACSSSLLRMPKSNKRAIMREKVFCDEANGIVCYRALDTGEVTCEGFDEGPYFDPPPSYKSVRAWQELSSPKNTLCHFEPKTQWDESLQMVILEGFDEG